MVAPDVILLGHGGPTLGTGHWVRLLALSRALTEHGFRCALYTDPTDHPALKASPVPIRSREQWGTFRHAKYRIAIQDPPDPEVTAETVVCLVDGDATLFHADLVVYQHFGTPTIRTRGQTLLGPQYACLRPPFATAHPSCEPQEREIERVLVSTGGNRIGVQLADNLCAALALNGYTPVRLGKTPYFGDVVSLMRSCQAAVTTASMTALEAMCLGLPLLTVALNAEQERLGRVMPASPYAGVFAWDWGLARQAWAAVDGQGIYRVAAEITKTVSRTSSVPRSAP